MPDGSRRPVEPGDVFLLAADGDDTLVRLRGKRPLHDVRPLGAVSARFEPHGFYRIHQRWAVNLRRLRAIRPRAAGDDWEVVLEPPVNRVLPVARARLAGLWARLE
ncbi:MAG TPA: LytTR family DNA-binding domain-containing protein [Thermoanaerobaculia bacterium]|nr:LytTR family DNA-binding domain-containing protein [Thermoanaerobaculia bacterium]